MLKKRIIPILLHNNLSLIKGAGFESWRRIGIVRPAIRVFNARDVDEIILLDITATNDQRGPDLELVHDISKDCFVPLTVGGGISSIQHVRDILRNGADKVALNTICYQDLKLVKEAAGMFGSQAIVASVDVLREGSEYICMSHSGTKKENVSLLEHLRALESAGVGEVLLTVINDEGRMQGFDLKLYEFVKNLISVPLIMSGGAGSISDVVRAFEEVSPSAVGISSLFAFTEVTPNEVKAALNEQGIQVRKSNLITV